MSLRFGGSTTLDNAVNAAINDGVFFAVAAGNDSSNACSFSPARVTAAYTVGTTTSSDAGSWFTNFGTCLDIFAPGSSIVSAGISSNSSSSTKSGTSMASPHVAGAAALVLSEDNSLTPAQVDSVLDSRATSGVLSSIGSGSPNRLLYTKSASSCTSACSLVDLVPTLSGSSSKVTTSGTYGSSYPAWKAFDSNATASSMWISETYETPAWIAYDFASSTRITHYTITNSNGSLTSRAPKDFKLQGWTGSSWVTVDNRTNETNWTSGVQRTYEVSSPGNYTKYRLYITDDNDSRSGVVVISIANLELLGCEPPPLVAPNACFTTNIFGSSVSVNASCSSDSDGSIVSYSWDMGDGTYRSGQSTSHFYSQDGTYVIRLTVTDNDGLTDTALDFVSVCQGGISPMKKSKTGEPLIPDCPVLQ
jgi:PKD repeat protein